MTGRTVPLWEGSTPDAAIPPRVRVRVFERFGGKCALTGRKLLIGDDWDVDHIKPLHLGGLHREDNLQPVLRSAHREKSKAEVSAKGKADRIRQKHLGIYPKPVRTLQGRGFSENRKKR